MGNLNGQELFTLSERLLASKGVDRALLLAAAASPGSGHAALSRLSIGERDRRILEWRRLLFGSQADSLATCPRCRYDVEFSFSIAKLLAEDGSGSQVSLSHEGCTAVFRLPNSQDLQTLETDRNVDGLRMKLLQRCLLTANTDDNTQLRCSDLPEALLDEVEYRMSQADPCADIRFELGCAQCGHEWVAPFDIVAFLFTELRSVARRVFQEVHVIARAYGWREADILEMSPQRRRTYVEMLRA